MALIIDPSTGFPSELITVPVIFASLTGEQRKVRVLRLLADRERIFCASAPLAVPGKYVGAYPEFGFDPVGPARGERRRPSSTSRSPSPSCRRRGTSRSRSNRQATTRRCEIARDRWSCRYVPSAEAGDGRPTSRSHRADDRIGNRIAKFIDQSP